MNKKQRDLKQKETSAEIKICFPFNFLAILQFASPVNELGDYLRHRSNFTFSVQDRDDRVSEMNSSTDGCIGRMQRNESDGVFQFVNYPLDVTGVQKGDIALENSSGVSTLYYSRTAS